jgi:hypothetical protein
VLALHVEQFEAPAPCRKWYAKPPQFFRQKAYGMACVHLTFRCYINIIPPSILIGVKAFCLYSLLSPLSARKEHVKKIKTGPHFHSGVIRHRHYSDQKSSKERSRKYFGLGGCSYKILFAMHRHCGGKPGRRYKAAAISACFVRDQDDPKSLHDLRKTWISHSLPS